MAVEDVADAFSPDVRRFDEGEDDLDDRWLP